MKAKKGSLINQKVVTTSKAPKITNSRYQNISLFKSQITTVSHLEKILNEIDGNERRILKGMFTSPEPLLIQIRSTNNELKEAFKSRVRDYLSVTHSTDWEALETGLIQQLNQHFLRWAKLFENFDREVKDSVHHKKQARQAQLDGFKENIEKIERTGFRPNPEVENYKLAEKDFEKNNDFLKARGIRAKRENLERKLEETFLLERKFEIDKKIARLKEKHQKEFALLQQTVFDEHEELVFLRNKELQDISIKYNKVARTVLNLHHFETHRSSYLTKQQVDNRRLVARQRNVKLKGEKVDDKLTITNKNTLTYLMNQILEEMTEEVGGLLDERDQGQPKRLERLDSSYDFETEEEKAEKKAKKEKYLEMLL